MESSELVVASVQNEVKGSLAVCKQISCISETVSARTLWDISFVLTNMVDILN